MSLLEYFFVRRRAKYASTYGTLLASRSLNNFSFHLYKVGIEYMEVWINNRRKSIFKIKTYKNDTCFEPYLDDIVLNIDSLMPTVSINNTVK
ncbi:MAG: hypothetical protein HC819_23285 [Cyclobacteriaceae bacterium]|nr:hypothetical protein [Cyclobacteriaceae bacterium]